MAEWTAEDAEQAKAEGWGIFECSGSEDGPWQLQKFDDPGQHVGAPSPYPFVADVDVWVHARAPARHRYTEKSWRSWPRTTRRSMAPSPHGTRDTAARTLPH